VAASAPIGSGCAPYPACVLLRRDVGVEKQRAVDRQEPVRPAQELPPRFADGLSEGAALGSGQGLLVVDVVLREDVDDADSGGAFGRAWASSCWRTSW
jgi:hypothetical protein